MMVNSRHTIGTFPEQSTVATVASAASDVIVVVVCVCFPLDDGIVLLALCPAVLTRKHTHFKWTILINVLN